MRKNKLKIYIFRANKNQQHFCKSDQTRCKQLPM